MSNARNAGVAGGVILLALWGGIGVFFGKGKNSKSKGDAPKANIERRVKPREDRPTRPVVRRKQAPTPARVTKKAPATPTKESYTYILRLKYIHPVLPSGEMSPQTIPMATLILKGRAAEKDKKELILKVKGDAKAKWLNQLKHELKKANVRYSISNDF